MSTLDLSKQTLGLGYLVGVGVVLSLALLAHAAWAFRTGPAAVLTVLIGVLPAITLAAANYWLPRSGLSGRQIWTVAEWSALGIGVLTLVNLALIISEVTVVVDLLASSVAIGGVVGILVGALLELRRERRRLIRCNRVLNRILRHDIRNRLTVMLGHLGELERTADGATADHTAELRATIEELITTAEKAKRVDAAMRTNSRPRESVDIVPKVNERLARLERTTPEATVDVDLPETAMVRADGLLDVVLDNVFENTVVHSTSAPTVTVRGDVSGRSVTLRVADTCPTIPDNELRAFEAETETPLAHSKGIGLWLVIWVVEGYGGTVSFGQAGEQGNVVTLELPRAGWLSPGRFADP